MAKDIKYGEDARKSLPGPSGGMKGPIKPHPYLAEYKFGSADPAVLMRFENTMGYQAWPFDVQKAFNPQK